MQKKHVDMHPLASGVRSLMHFKSATKQQPQAKGFLSVTQTHFQPLLSSPFPCLVLVMNAGETVLDSASNSYLCKHNHQALNLASGHTEGKPTVISILNHEIIYNVDPFHFIKH